MTAEPIASPDDLLTVDQVAQLTTIPVGTLRYWRHLDNGTGPRSFKLGPRRVAYRRGDVEAWIAQQYSTDRTAPAPLRIAR